MALLVQLAMLLLLSLQRHFIVTCLQMSSPLTHSGPVMPLGQYNLASIGSGNGLLPDSSKLSPEPM